MIHASPENRIARGWTNLLVGLAAFACGCSRSEPTGPTATVTVKRQASAPALSVGPTKSPEPPAPVATLSAAKAEADAFLKLLPSDVAAASAKIAVAFKKQVTGSLTYEDEKKLGYSESDTQKYLKEASAGVTEWELRTVVAAPNGTDFSLRGEAATAAGPARFSVRVAKADDRWQVTRFAVTKVLGQGAVRADGDFEQIWVRETALDFLDALTGSDADHALTMAAMTEPFKKRVPDKFPADTGLGYSKRDVRNWLNDLRQGVTGYDLTAQRVDAKGRAFTGHFTGKATAFKLWAVRDTDGNWKIDEFKTN